MKNPFKSLTKFEWGLWISSVVVVTVSFVLYSTDYLTLTASLIGVTALIFISKGMVFGQIFMCGICGILRNSVIFFCILRGDDNIFVHERTDSVDECHIVDKAPF